MPELTADVAVLGSGFGGSLTVLLLERIGLRPVLIDRGKHPRFAIGESSTPIADFLFRALSRKYDLPRLEPLAKFGTWRETYPHLVCGLKRGFSYFHHRAGQSFQPQSNHANELLVAASSDDLNADTHWLRSDVDAFLVNEVQAAGVPYFDQTDVSLTRTGDAWQITGRRSNEDSLHIQARFVVDATGAAGVLSRTLEIPQDLDGVRTNSRAIYAHFADLRPWHDVLVSAGGRIDDHPFCCDAAAQHHILDEGWMWQLRFENGVTSAGIVLAVGDDSGVVTESAEDEWMRVLDRYPSLSAQFETARIFAPAGGLQRTGRLQRRAARMAGENWCLLPNTAGFIDPLHSTGIAQTLCGVERLIGILSRYWGKTTLLDELQRYEQTLRREFTLIDQLVSGCYSARRHFRLFAAFAMLYFAAATTYEHRRFVGKTSPGCAFLCADDEEFCRIVCETQQRLKQVLSKPIDEKSFAEFEKAVSEAIVPFNIAGLNDRSVQNMYRYTVAPIE